MICDEVWEYDPDEQAARLTDLQILCLPCNAVIHLGQAWARLGHEADADAAELMARVNGTRREEAEKEIESVWQRWLQLGIVEDWTINVSESIRTVHPALVSIHGLVIGKERATDSQGSGPIVTRNELRRII